MRPHVLRSRPIHLTVFRKVDPGQPVHCPACNALQARQGKGLAVSVRCHPIAPPRNRGDRLGARGRWEATADDTIVFQCERCPEMLEYRIRPLPEVAA